jgi:hypothetical protein
MAEFHDPVYLVGMNLHQLGNSIGSWSAWPTGDKPHGAWTMRGYGHLRSDVRFWTYINDQPANCWNP